LALAVLITPTAALVILLIVAPMRTLIATEAPGLLPLDIGQLALGLLIAAWGTAAVVRTRALPSLLPSPIFIPLLGFVTAAGLSAFAAWSMSAWLTEWLKWLQILLLLALCLSIARDWEWILFGLVAAGVANALIGIYEFFGGSGALHLLVNERFFRAFGTFGQPNPFGGFMGLLTPVALAAALGFLWRWWTHWRATRHLPHAASYRDLWIGGFYAASSVLMAVALIMSWSRGAWLGFAVSIGVLALALPRRLWVGVGIVGAAGAVVVALWASGRLPDTIVSRLASATDEIVNLADVRGVDITPENYANVERLAHWQAAINMATAHPWLGVGFGNYETAYPAFRLLNWDLALGHAHNYYLNVFGETGIIGLAAYLTLWLSLVIFAWRTRRHPNPVARCVGVGLLGSWVYLAVHSLTDNLYVNNVFLHVGAMISLLAIIDYQTHSSRRWSTRQA
jgi:O-antigen ligase